MSLRVFDDLESLSRAGAQRLEELAQSAVARSGRFVLGLSGGRTPGRLYELLADTAVDWRRTHILWCDERCVPPDHEASNFRMARTHLLDHVAVPEDQVHRIPGERPPEEAAAAYDDTVAGLLGAPSPGADAGLDTAVLGVGADGHTASLFPGGKGLDVGSWAAAGRAPRGGDARDRVTLTLAALNRTRHVIFLASGPEKADAVAGALDPEDEHTPAGRVQGLETTEWFLDRTASGLP